MRSLVILGSTGSIGTQALEVAEQAGKFDFVLADLGVSSMQIDNPDRGFTFKYDGPLDLRLDPTAGGIPEIRKPFVRILTQLDPQGSFQLLRGKNRPAHFFTAH